MLVCNNVTCEYNEFPVFAGLSFNAAAGSLIVLHGPNGSGKTSFLKMLAGIKKPADGEINWNERSLKESIKDGEVVINYIAHENAIKPDLTVLENIQFWTALNGEDSRIDAAINYFDLARYADTRCADLSKGWQKRVSLSRLITCPSDIWLLDEPYNNLDSSMSQLVDNLISGHAKDGGLVVVSSHTHVPIDFAIKLNISDFAPSRVAA